MFKALGLGLGLIALPLGYSSVASASMFSLTSDHCSPNCGTPPFGTVTVTQDGTAVDVSVSLTGSNQFVTLGSTDEQYFKFNGAGGAITPTQNVPGVTLIGDTGAFIGDGTGNFNFGITCDTGSCDGLPIGTMLMFEVANTTVAALTQPNNVGIIFVAGILSGTTGNVGPVDASASPTPLPGALPLFATGLGALGLLGWRRKRKAQATA